MCPKEMFVDPHRPRKVMLCEDEMIVAMDLKMILEDEGYEVLGAFASAAAAKEALAAETPVTCPLRVPHS